MADPEKNKRFLVPEDSYVVLGPDFNKVGRVIDIGMDGLRFGYLGDSEQSDKSFKLDIFLSSTDFYMERVPCEMISEAKIPKSSYGPLSIRKCTVQFGELTPYQMSQLEYFIQNHAIKKE